MNITKVAIDFANRLSLERSLTQDEADALNGLICAERRERNERNQPPIWTAKEIRSLQQMRRKRLSYREIALKLGRSEIAVRVRAHRLAMGAR